MSKKALRSIGTLTLAFLLLTTLAFATSGLSAWCIVPALNGSANSEDTAVKETTGSSAYLYSATVGGGYEVDCRQRDLSNNVSGAWTRDISSVNNAAYLEGVSRMFAGHEVCLQFSNNLTTPVRVEVNGSWDSN